MESEAKFCVYLFTGYSLPCDAGFICLTGSNVPNPTDGIIGYICPSGHYCLSGAVTQTLCDIGTYAPSTGLGKYIDFAYLTNKYFFGKLSFSMGDRIMIKVKVVSFIGGGNWSTCRKLLTCRKSLTNYRYMEYTLP